MADQPQVIEGQIIEGQIVVSQRVVIEQAPPVARMALSLLQASDPPLLRVDGNTINFAGQVTYRVVGWDAVGSALLLEREGPWLVTSSR